MIEKYLVLFYFFDIIKLPMIIKIIPLNISILWCIKSIQNYIEIKLKKNEKIYLGPERSFIEGRVYRGPPL